MQKYCKLFILIHQLHPPCFSGDMQTSHFGYFGYTWLCTPKMIVSTWKLQCSCACQKVKFIIHFFIEILHFKESCNLSDWNWAWTHNHLVRKRTLNHLGKLACFKQGAPWHSGNYRVGIRSETRMWHDKNIQKILQFDWLAAFGPVTGEPEFCKL